MVEEDKEIFRTVEENNNVFSRNMSPVKPLQMFFPAAPLHLSPAFHHPYSMEIIGGSTILPSLLFLLHSHQKVVSSHIKPTVPLNILRRVRKKRFLGDLAKRRRRKDDFMCTLADY